MDIRYFIVVILLFQIVSCFRGAPPTKEDVARLKELRDKHLRQNATSVQHIKYSLKPNSNGVLYRPVVLMYGIKGNFDTMAEVEQWIKESLPSIYVKRIQIGNGFWDSIFMPMNDQVKEFCQHITADENLKYGFNLLGYSQGSLISRGFIERCNTPAVYNFISWAGPQAGLFGLPYINIPLIDYYLGGLAYWEPIQSWLAPAQYWRNPYELSEYENISLFLADLNNERKIKNESYKKNIISLNQLILVYSINDVVITPRESGWFYFFKEDSDEIESVQNTTLYREDWIGIKTLNQNQKIYFGKTDCEHNSHHSDVCKEYFYQHTLPFLNNTLPSSMLQ